MGARQLSNSAFARSKAAGSTAVPVRTCVDASLSRYERSRAVGARSIANLHPSRMSQIGAAEHLVAALTQTFTPFRGHLPAPMPRHHSRRRLACVA